MFSRQTKPKDVALSQVTQNNEMLTGGGGCCCEREVNVTRVIGEPNLVAAAQEEVVGTRFFRVHQRGTAVDAIFQYCIAFPEKQP